MPFETWLKYPVVFLAGALATLLLTPIVRRLAGRAGWMDLPAARRIHRAPVPRAGGLAVFFGFHAACALVFLAPWKPFVGQLDLRWWLAFLPVSAWLVLVGLADDARGLRPEIKLLGQALAAAGAYALDIRVGNALGFELLPAVDFIITVVWILAFVNAFNLIDGMDGLAAGLAAIAAAGIGGNLLLRHQPGDFLVCLGLIGACLAFLRFNFHPASVFLGDTGSMFLGLTLACVSLSSAAKGAALTSVAVPLLAAGVPLFDALLAVWRRTARRLGGVEGDPARLLAPDADHLHHRLLRVGLSQKGAAVWLYALAAALVALALAGVLYRSQAAGIFLLAFAGGAFVVVKHLARVELWDSGAAIVRGLRRPSGKVVAVIAFPVIDVFVLAAALWFALWLMADAADLQILKDLWLRHAPAWIGAPFLALLAAQTYRRVWRRARLSEIFELELALVLGALGAAALTLIAGRGGGKPLLLRALLFTGFSIAGVLTSRMFLSVLQDALARASRHPMFSGRDDLRPTLVYGAGSRGALYLSRGAERFDATGVRQRVIGVLDDDSNLHGRLVHGYNVLGGARELPRILARYRVRDIVVTTALAPDHRRQLLAAARQSGVTVWDWKISLESAQSGFGFEQSNAPAERGAAEATLCPASDAEAR